MKVYPVFLHRAKHTAEEVQKPWVSAGVLWKPPRCIRLNAEVKQLVIGHFSARYEDESVLLNEAAAIFPQTVLARENMCITINNYTDTRDYDPL